MKDKIVLPMNTDNAEAEKAALALPKVADAVAGKDIKKVIVVPNKLINIVVG